MHVVLLSARIPPTVDGVGDHTAYLAKALLGLRMRVTIACGIQPQYAPPSGVQLWAGAFEQARQSLSAWVNQLAALRPDWLLLQYVPYAFQRKGLPFFLPSLLKKARQVGIRTGVFFHEVHIRPSENRFISLGQQWIARQLGQQADLAVTSIPFYQAQLAALGTVAHILPVGANLLVPEPPTVKNEEIRQFCFPGKAFVVSTFGRRDVSALAEAVAQMPDAGLLVLGDSRPAALPSVTYTTGYLSASEVCTWLRCGDIFALPDPKAPDGTGGTSLKSGSLAAAFAVGLPAVGVRGDLAAFPLVHGENIWLIEQPSAEGWRQALAYLRHQPTLCQRLAQGGHRLYKEYLDWSVLAAAFEQLLKK